MILHYYEKGNKDDPVILFLHGSASDATVWLRELAVIAAHGFRCIALDLRGHGVTKDKAQPLEHVKLDLDTHIQDVKDTLRDLGVLPPLKKKEKPIKGAEELANVEEEEEAKVKPNKKIIIVTHSFGGIIAINLAKQFPELVDRLVLVSMPPKLNFIMRTFLNFLIDKPLELVQGNLDRFAKLPMRKRYKSSVTTNAHVLKEIFKHVRDWNGFKEASTVKCPVHFAAGRFDMLANASDIYKLHQCLENSTYELFKWASHALMEDQPEKFEKWLIEKIS